MSTTATEPSFDLNHYGGACRCLLRLREDQGLPEMSDRRFIRDHLVRYPEWNQRPGQVDLRTMIQLAEELGVADRFEVSRDFAHVLHAHRSGARVLVCTERPPQVSLSELPYDRYVTVLERMDEESFTLWCPFRSGLSDLLPAAKVVWWDSWCCVGLLLRKSAEIARG